MTYGKFASAEELLKGYNQLEKSFTQKCQQLAALKAAVDKSQQEFSPEKIENSNVETTSTAAQDSKAVEKVLDNLPVSATMETANSTDENSAKESVTAEHQSAEPKVASEELVPQESNVAEAVSEDVKEVQSANTEQQQENVDNAHLNGTATPKTLVGAPNAPKSVADNAGTNNASADNSNANGTATPKTLASARDAATKLFETNNASTSPDGTSVETPPSSAEQSTTVDSADTVPQSEPDAPVLDGHATASPTESQLQQYLLNNPKFAWQLLQQTSQPPQIMTGGGNVSLALPSRPKTIKEASLMAKQLFKN